MYFGFIIFFRLYDFIKIPSLTCLFGELDSSVNWTQVCFNYYLNDQVVFKQSNCVTSNEYIEYANLLFEEKQSPWDFSGGHYY